MSQAPKPAGSAADSTGRIDLVDKTPRKLQAAGIRSRQWQYIMRDQLEARARPGNPEKIRIWSCLAMMTIGYVSAIEHDVEIAVKQVPADKKLPKGVQVLGEGEWKNHDRYKLIPAGNADIRALTDKYGHRMDKKSIRRALRALQQDGECKIEADGTIRLYLHPALFLVVGGGANQTPPAKKSGRTKRLTPTEIRISLTSRIRKRYFPRMPGNVEIPDHLVGDPKIHEAVEACAARRRADAIEGFTQDCKDLFSAQEGAHQTPSKSQKGVSTAPVDGVYEALAYKEESSPSERVRGRVSRFVGESDQPAPTDAPSLPAPGAKNGHIPIPAAEIDLSRKYLGEFHKELASRPTDQQAACFTLGRLGLLCGCIGKALNAEPTCRHCGGTGALPSRTGDTASIAQVRQFVDKRRSSGYSITGYGFFIKVARECQVSAEEWNGSAGPPGSNVQVHDRKLTANEQAMQILYERQQRRIRAKGAGNT